jgi:DNA-binding NarL/FixJ family response regulator
MTDPTLANIGLTRDQVIAYFGRAPRTPPRTTPPKIASSAAPESAPVLKRSILKLKCTGMTSLQIARELRITTATVNRILEEQTLIK